MSLTRIGLLLIFAASIVACASVKENTTAANHAASQSQANELMSIVLDRNFDEGVTEVSLNGTGKFVYSIFRMSDPQRIIVDISNCEVNEDNIGLITDVDDGLLTVISTNRFLESGKPVTRVMLAFEQDTEFTVADNSGVITLRLAHPADYAKLSEPEAKPVVQKPVAKETVKQAIAIPDVPVCNGDEPLMLVKYDNEVSKVKITSVVIKQGETGALLTIKSDGKIKNGSYQIMRLCNPDRLVVDVFGAKSGIRSKSIKGDGVNIEKIRLGKHADKLRMVMDLGKNLPIFDLQSDSGQLVFALDAKSNNTVEIAKTTETIKEEPVKTVVAETVINTKSTMLGLEFKHGSDSSLIELDLAGNIDYRLVKGANGQVILELPNTEIPESLEQSLDTSEFDSPVTLVSTYVADAKNNLVKVVVQTRYKAKNSIKLLGSKLVWSFDIDKSQNQFASSATGTIAVNSDGQTVIEYQPEESAGMQNPAMVAMQANTRADALGSSNQRISLELKNTDIMDVLRLIADVSKLNIIASDDVNGTITVRLLNVPWQQALGIILRSKGLGMERLGNIIRVAPLEVLQKEEEIKMAKLKIREELEPLHVRLIPVSYSTAANLIDQVKDLLSGRGTVNYDERTNTIIVKDIDEVLANAEDLITKLDLQTPQVMIEAKIVEADITNDYGFGVQWGGYYTMGDATGNPTGLAFPSSFGVAGNQDYLSSPGIANTSQPANWVVNLPTNGTPTGGLGFTFGNASNTANLTFRLTALESAGKIKIISSPRISTLDNTEATIQQGMQIPIMTTTVTGMPATKMIQADLELKVTPHITADGSIIMQLEITKEEPDFSRTNALGDPAIIDKSAKTEVLVRTGETTVIGGIYTKKTNWKEGRVPLFSKIPVLGWLFKNRSSSVQKTELLIFVTPRIINRSQSSLITE